ncbi:MAG: flagellar basal body P-ring protein FlgI [Gammaproteobacteria bacterium]|nr:flagellar basal body P-ring protein FlgI [Gammaproteobacteria bacterium]
MNIFRFLAISLLLVTTGAAQAERIKDLTSIQGVRDNDLVGYGLIVGLTGSGDSANSAPYTGQSMRSMLKRLGVNIPDGVTLDTKNVAAVALSATLPAFAKPGQKIDVNVSSIGNAASLKGGTLLMTSLRGVDGEVYAIAQGNVIVGGVGVQTANGNSVTINVPTAGRIPSGASVERAVPSPFANGNHLVLDMHSADFTTANRIVDAINETFGKGTASAIDGGSIAVRAPATVGEKVGFIAELENLELTPGDAAARIVVNSRTGTVVIGRHVKISATAVSHGNLTVTVTSTPQVSQPNAFAGGNTAVVNQENVNVSEEKNPAFVFDPGVSLDDIVNAINRVGASPSDLIAILEALKAAGALRAELIVI